MKTICTICARGGSQGVKNKNILSLRGKPLIAHTILQAKKAALFDMIVVSSDSKKIGTIAKEWGADLIIQRPDELASATAGKLAAIQHAVLETERLKSCLYDIVVDLDVTSPLRSIEDISDSFQLFTQHATANNLITVFPSRRSPYFNMIEMDANGFARLAKPLNKPILRRQDSPVCYDMNASIYIWKREHLFRGNSVINQSTLAYVMPEERSIDIDSHTDLKIVRFLAKQRKDLA